VFLIPEPSRPHVGSIDVDLAVDHTRVTEDGYETIRKHLLSRGYEEARAILQHSAGKLATSRSKLISWPASTRELGSGTGTRESRRYT